MLRLNVGRFGSLGSESLRNATSGGYDEQGSRSFECSVVLKNHSFAVTMSNRSHEKSTFYCSRLFSSMASKLSFSNEKCSSLLMAHHYLELSGSSFTGFVNPLNCNK